VFERGRKRHFALELQTILIAGKGAVSAVLLVALRLWLESRGSETRWWSTVLP